MKYYRLKHKWPLYYLKDGNFIPIGNNFEIKDRSGYIVEQELDRAAALKFLDTYLQPSDILAAKEIIMKQTFYEEILGSIDE